jgi:glycosyltransferase involved in cell wall biosynthesis
MPALNILHVFRTPVGGLFRHVTDLTRGQAERGHRVGIIADSSTGGQRADDVFRSLEPHLALGLTRFPMRRHPSISDLSALIRVFRRIGELQPDVLHGHGAKGGAYARLAPTRKRPVRAYTPHGGSLLFGHDTLAGRFYLNAERLLMIRGDLFLFESEYAHQTFRSKIGSPRGLVRVVHNGVSRQEFAPVAMRADATDLVFMGELRPVKGINFLIDAIAELRRQGRAVTATLVGDGPEREALHAQVERLDLTGEIRFMPAMSAREAQTYGRIMVVPSRAESLPYVVLEAAAAGVPMIATRVGGIPEIYGPLSDHLVEPENPAALAIAIGQALDRPAATAEIARGVRERVAASFSVETMVDGVLSAYDAAMVNLRTKGRR